ncbi:MAG: S8 family serine peptidase [Sphingomonas bacterium]|nr:S8 family serine peptidase [Sphingomonas bacterium]
MRRTATAFILLAAGIGTASQVFAQNGPVPEQASPSPQPRRGGGIGLPSIGFSISFGGKRKKSPPREQPDAPLPEIVDGQLIFTFRGTVADAAAAATRAGLSVVELWPLDSIDAVMVTASLTAPDTIQTGEWRLRRLRGVLAVQPNQMFQVMARSGRLPDRFALHGVPTKRVPATTTIAMIDTPVAVNHETLRGTTISETARDVVRLPGVHGTAVASLIVGQGAVPGSAQGAQLLNFAAFSETANGRATSQTRFLAKALNDAARARPNVLVLAWGGKSDPLLASLIATLSGHGTCVVAAAGNDGPNAAVSFPATMPQVLAVTAVDSGLRPYRFASRGMQIGVSAAGVDLLTAVPAGYRPMSGTSFAAAFAGGVISRMEECASAHNPAAMQRRVAAQARDLGTKGSDPVFGAGLLMLAQNSFAAD